MKVLLVGSGGREHALAWGLAQSSECSSLICAPGNAGISAFCKCFNVGAEDIDGLVALAKGQAVDLVMVGPEAPLVAGLADRLREEGFLVVGPSAKAAQLEGSKAFMKDFCKKYSIPTARYERFTDLDQALVHIDSYGDDETIVVKADGLAAGKGVIIAETKDQAKEAAREMLSGEAFGAAGQEIVIEEFLDGEEMSFFVISDGKTWLPLASAQDHKRAYDEDKGPNTGGMGAYSPARLDSPELTEQIMKQIINPTLEGMAADGMPFQGILFAGLMITKDGPKLIEYNVRFGDPECQTLMVRLQSDLLDLFAATARGTLDQLEPLSWLSDPSVCVVMAAEGYPASYAKGTVIKGIEETVDVEDVNVFHAGTARNEAGELVNVGGRVLGVTARGVSFYEARGKAYRAVGLVDWPKGFYRKDIGWRML